jgi:hypothetical protein
MGTVGSADVRSHRGDPLLFDGQAAGVLVEVGPHGRFRIPIVANGRPAVNRWDLSPCAKARAPCLGIAIAFLAAVTVAASRRRLRGLVGVGLGVLAGLAALAVTVGFALRDQTKGGTDWHTIGIAVLVALALTVLLVRATGQRRVQVAGLAGVLAAAAMITALPIFWHGVVISALPATSARLACALALLAGASAP